MKIRIKKKETKLFFDSFKHLKNNLSNLVCMELPTLIESKDAQTYLNLKLVNYKSKYPDMRKMGLINYNKPSDNDFKLTEFGEIIYNIIKTKKKHFDYDNEQKRLDSIKPHHLFELLNHEEKKEITKCLITLLISYYDTADAIRPYLSLIKVIETHNIKKLDNDVLCNLLAQTKENILRKKIIENAFNDLNENIQEELKRPISYILNSLETAGIIDETGMVVYDKDLVKNIVMQLDEIYFETRDNSQQTGRSAEEQRNFRNKVLEAYDYKCAITGQSIEIINPDGSTLYLLEAAHIIPYSDSGSFSVNNGIALSYEMHKLFDRRLLSFRYREDGNVEVIVSKSKRIKNSGILSKIDGKLISLPKNRSYYPDETALNYRTDDYLLR